ncbi:MAG: hypothetical protein ACI9T7_000173 [Oleiphilaceae bacterium]|jgi:hypothetical protein
MKLQFRSSYQGVAEYNVIKHCNNCQIRLRHNQRTGVVHIDDWSNELDVEQRKSLFRDYLNFERLDRNKVRAKYKILTNQVEKDIYKSVFLKAIEENKRLFRANKNLH